VARLATAEQKIQEREVHQLKKLAEENERLNRENQLLAEKRTRQVKAAHAFEREQLEKKRQDFDEQERAAEEKQAVLAKQRQTEIALFAKTQAEKIRRNYELRKSRQISDEDMKRRLDNIDRLNAEKANAARMSRSDSTVKAQHRADEYRKKIADRQRQMDEVARRRRRETSRSDFGIFSSS
jgi:hypothetical protein